MAEEICMTKGGQTEGGESIRLRISLPFNSNGTNCDIRVPWGSRVLVVMQPQEIGRGFNLCNRNLYQVAAQDPLPFIDGQLEGGDQ